MKHLLAGRIPGVVPIWVGTKGWKRTMHAAIDVDYRGDKRDFKRRCKMVEKVLLRLGIPRGRMLVCPSPSGGRHYRIVFRRPVDTYQLPNLFQMAGLPLAPGQFEVFPSETRGLRLPFGYIPGHKHDPLEWVTFIQAYKRKKFPRINWDQMVKRALSIQQRACIRPLMNTAAPKPTFALNSPTVKLGIPRRFQKLERQPQPFNVTGQNESSPLKQKTKVIWRERVQKIWEKGIPEPGTRLSLTKTLAWHLMFVDHLPAEKVSIKITEWAYRTGKRTSKDVQADLETGSRKVGQQIREIVRWYEEQL